ncbi:MAG: hypothetical protein U9Q15_05275 [Patescibacteria group bacterium]|nr:hypothetical protein [Patescibacteria group bacterium]
MDTPRAFPDIIAQVANKSNTVKRMFYSRWEKYVMDDFDHSQSQQVDWVCGHMFIMRSDLWDRIGGLDTDYFMYMTDAQMSKDTLALGYKTYYNASIAVDIIREASSKAIRPIDIFKKVLVRQHVVDALLYYWKN